MIDLLWLPGECGNRDSGTVVGFGDTLGTQCHFSLRGKKRRREVCAGPRSPVSTQDAQIEGASCFSLEIDAAHPLLHKIQQVCGPHCGEKVAAWSRCFFPSNRELKLLKLTYYLLDWANMFVFCVWE